MSNSAFTVTGTTIGGSVAEVDTGTGLTGGPITSVGTISLEVPVVVSSGGTGLTSAGANGVFVSDNSNAPSWLSNGTAGEVLTANTGAAPSWQPLPADDVTSVSGTTNRTTVSPTTGACVVDISSSYVGQTSITTLGTIGTGDWNGTPIVVSHGGTGLTSAGADGVLISDGSSIPSWLSNGSTGQVLTATTGSPPSWQTSGASGVSSIAGTTNQITASASTGAVTLSLPSVVQVSSEVAITASVPSSASYQFYSDGAFGTQVTATGCSVQPTFAATTTTLGCGFSTQLSTAASSFTATDLIHFKAGLGTIGSGSSITNQTGFSVPSTLTGATNNYGFRSSIASATGHYNVYADGTAINYFAGKIGIGIAAPSSTLSVAGTMAIGAVFVGSFAPSNGMIVQGQVGIGVTAPSASAMLAVSSTTSGFLPPVMTTTQKTAIASPAAGLIVYDSTLAKLCVRTASAWETITSV